MRGAPKPEECLVCLLTLSPPAPDAPVLVALVAGMAFAEHGAKSTNAGRLMCREHAHLTRLLHPSITNMVRRAAAKVKAEA